MQKSTKTRSSVLRRNWMLRATAVVLAVPAGMPAFALSVRGPELSDNDVPTFITLHALREEPNALHEETHNTVHTSDSITVTAIDMAQRPPLHGLAYHLPVGKGAALRRAIAMVISTYNVALSGYGYSRMPVKWAVLHSSLRRLAAGPVPSMS